MSGMVIVGGIFATTAAYASYRLVQWVKGRLLRRSFSNFTSKYIQKPSKDMSKAVATNAQFMTEIEQYLQHRGICDYIEKTGSTYDGLNIDEDHNIHLKVFVIQTVNGFDIEAEKRSDMPGYAWLRYTHGRESSPVFDRVLRHWGILGTLMGNRYVDAEKTVDLIHDELQKCFSTSKQMKGKVILHRSGIFLQMGVYPDSWWLSWGNCLCTVHIIPAYKIGDELYESRPIDGDAVPSDDTMTWHRSFALQERQKLCDGAKLVLRVLKVLRKREADFGNFTSYQLKTVVLHETDVNEDWSEVMFGRRLADVLARLEKCLAARSIPHYFLPEINLLSKMPSFTVDYLRDRIKRLRSNESEMRKILQ